jgi:hypothetical protein
MKRFLLYIIFLLLSLNIRSQEAFLVSELYPELRYHDLKGTVFFSDYRQVKGSPYLYDDWMNGNIFLDNGKVIQNVMMKLDVYAHRVLVYHENLKRVVLLEKQHTNEFILRITGEEKRFRKLMDVNSKSKVFDGCFFEVLSEGEISLFKLNYRDVYPINNPNEIYIDEFTNEEDYIVYVNNDYKQIRLGRSYFFHNYPEYKDQLRKYFRKNKLKIRTEKDFVKSIDHLNEIIQIIKIE